MRNYILTILLASSVAMPALAQDQGGFGGRHRDRAERSTSAQGEDNRPARVERAERTERAERPDYVRRERPQVGERANWSDRGAERQRAVEQQQAHRQAVEQQVQVRQDRSQQFERRSWQRQRSDNGAAVLQQQRYAPSIDQRREYRRDGWNGQRAGTSGTFERSRDRQGEVTVNHYSGDRYQSRRSGSTAQWSNQWRTDRNYDWRRYRDRNRSTFRLGYYNDPYGSRYRRFSIGFSLFPSYYQSNYWLDDPWMYRLPPAYGPYRWVRYYGDALLVNIYTGRVVDVVHDFFW